MKSIKQIIWLVKTQHRVTERKVVEKIICPGDPWSSMQCSVQIDSIGRDSLAEDLEPSKYKVELEIPALGMIYDILTKVAKVDSKQPE